jgi:hypothetical protein
MGSNRGNHPKHAPGHICYKDGNPNKKKAKQLKTKQIATGKKRAEEARRAANP